MNLYLQDFKKRQVKDIFWNISLSKGQPSQTFSFASANLTCDRQVGNCLFLRLIYLLTLLTSVSVQANSVDPDQTASVVTFQQMTKADNFCLDWRFNG